MNEGVDEMIDVPSSFGSGLAVNDCLGIKQPDFECPFMGMPQLRHECAFRAILRSRKNKVMV
jgi:hypothetical protein